MPDPYVPFGFMPPRLPRLMEPPLPQAIPPMSAFGFAPLPSSPTAAGGLMPQSEAEATDLASQPNVYRGLIEASGLGSAGRSREAFAAGRPWVGLGNAAVAAMPFRPAFGFAGLGAAYGGALAEQLGMLGGPAPAHAQQQQAIDPQARIRQLDADIDKASKELTTLGRRVQDPDRLDVLSRPITLRLNQLNEERSRMQSMLGTAATNAADEAARQRRQEQEEYARTVRRAEEARARERARDVRFEDTPVGQIWNSTSGLMPAIVGGATGAILRGAHGPGRSILWPLGEGTLGGAFSYNVPLGFNAMGTPFENPERRAQEAYARELPLGNPIREQTEAYASTLPVVNPLREAASREFWDLGQAGKRMLFGAGEGLLGAGLGVAGVGIGGRIHRALSGRGGLSPSGTGPSPTSPTPSGPVTPTQPDPGLASLSSARRGIGPYEPPPPAPAVGPPRPMPPGAYQDAGGRWRVGNRWIRTP